MNSFEDTPLTATQPVGSEAAPEALPVAESVAAAVQIAANAALDPIPPAADVAHDGKRFLRQSKSLRTTTELEARAIYLGLPREKRSIATVQRIMREKHGEGGPSHHTVAWWAKRYRWIELSEKTDAHVLEKSGDAIARAIAGKVAPVAARMQLTAIEMLEAAASAGLAQAAAVAAMSADYKGLVAGAVEALQFANVLKGGVSNRVSVGSGVYNESDASLITELQRRSVLADANPRPSDHET